MKYEQTPIQSAAAYQVLRAQADLNYKEERLVEAYQSYKILLAAKDYDGAREYLRSMPNCAAKVLCFREIILAEEQDNDIN